MARGRVRQYARMLSMFIGEIEGVVFKVIRVFKVLDDLKTSQS